MANNIEYLESFLSKLLLCIVYQFKKMKYFTQMQWTSYWQSLFKGVPHLPFDASEVIIIIIIYFHFYYWTAAAALNTGTLGFINDWYHSDNILVMVAIFVVFSLFPQLRL